MKAVRVQEFGGPGVLGIENIADPVAGAGQVVVAVKAAGVNPMDTYIRAGTYARKPSLPFTPGTDAGGVVETVGPGVKSIKIGDRVYVGGTLTGTYADKTLCDASRVHRIPERVSFAQAAGVNVPYATAYHALVHVAKIRAGEMLLVHGASGGVGTASVQIGRAMGVKVIGTAGSDRGRELVLEQGAQHAINHHAPDFNDQVLAATNGKGPDVIIEMLANVNLDKDLKLIGFRGRIVVVGNRGTIEINARDAMTKDASIHGMLLFNVTDDELAGIHSAIYAGLEDGSFRPVVGKEIKLEDAPKAHEAVMAAGALGKVVLIP